VKGQRLTDADLSKYNCVGEQLPQLLENLSSGKCAAHAQNILGVEDVASAMSGLTVRSKKVNAARRSRRMSGTDVRTI